MTFLPVFRPCSNPRHAHMRSAPQSCGTHSRPSLRCIWGVKLGWGMAVERCGVGRSVDSEMILHAMESEAQFACLDPVARRALMSTMYRQTLEPKQSVCLHDHQTCVSLSLFATFPQGCWGFFVVLAGGSGALPVRFQISYKGLHRAQIANFSTGLSSAQTFEYGLQSCRGKSAGRTPHGHC